MQQEMWFELPPQELPTGIWELRVRQWRPGDGLSCKSLNQGGGRRRLPCGEPFLTAGERRVGGKSERFFVLCELHSAIWIRDHVEPCRYSRKSLIEEATQAAQEEVIANHWDEYRAAMESHREQVCDRYISQLPKWLVGVTEGGDRS